MTPAIKPTRHTEAVTAMAMMTVLDCSGVGVMGAAGLVVSATCQL